MTAEEKTEFKDLLLHESNKIEEEGVLRFAKRMQLSDPAQKKIGRILELLAKL